jgi:tetratricopeptide (TPR) repeat protein
MKGPLNKLREVVARSPADAQGWYALGAKALEIGDVAEATQALMRSVQLAPHDIDRAIVAGLSLLGAGQVSEAEHLVRTACEHAPGRTDGQIALARIYLGSGRASEAIGLLGRVERADTRSIDAHLLSASAYEEMGMLVDAADHLALALSIDSYHVEATQRLGGVLERLGDGRGVVRCLRRLATLTRGEDFQVLTTLGITLSSLGRHNESIDVLKEVAKRRRDIGSAYADLGLAQLTAGRLDDALASISKALQLEPKSAQVHCALGLCHQKMGRWREAAQAFTATEQLAPDLVVGPLNLGLTLDVLGDRAGARRALLRAAALDPQDREIQVALARLFAPPSSGSQSGAKQSTVETAAPGAAIAGDLSTIAFLDVLEFLRLQGRSGTLALSSPRGAGEVRLFRGQITSAATSATKRFDQALIEGKVVSKGNLESFLARSGNRNRESAELLGSLLVRERVIEPRPLAQLLSRRIHVALTEILSWPEGPFSFHSEEGLAEPVIFFNLQDVTMELLRATQERNKQGLQRPAR